MDVPSGDHAGWTPSVHRSFGQPSGVGMSARAPVPSALATQTWEPWSPLPSNTIWRPSGDHAGAFARTRSPRRISWLPVPSGLTRVAPPESAGYRIHGSASASGEGAHHGEGVAAR